MDAERHGRAGDRTFDHAESGTAPLLSSLLVEIERSLYGQLTLSR